MHSSSNRRPTQRAGEPVSSRDDRPAPAAACHWPGPPREYDHRDEMTIPSNEGDAWRSPRRSRAKTRVGWIGTGVMGRWMCQHLMTKGYPATVYNRTKDKAQPLLDAGAAWADTPRSVAEQSDVVFAIVGFPEDVREVFLGPQGALAGSKAGTRPGGHDHERAVAGPRRSTRRPRPRAWPSLDAPVSGGDVGARTRPCRSWSAATPKPSTPCGRCRVHGQDHRPPGRPPAPASTPRWSTRS